MAEKQTQTVTANGEGGAAQNGSNGSNSSWWMDLIVRHRLLFNLVVHNALFALALLVAYLVWFGAANRVLDSFREQVLARAIREGWPEAITRMFRTATHSQWFIKQYLPQLPFFLLVKSLVFGRVKLFRGWWQYAGMRDVAKILLASWISLMVAYLAVVVLYWLPGRYGRTFMIPYSDGVLVLDFMVTVFLVSTARLSVRLYREEFRPISAEGVRRVLVIGAGNAAETLLREIHKMRVERYRVIGLVDDDPTKKDIVIHGIPVLGGTDDITDICEDENIDEILIAVPSATQKELRRIIEKCQGTKLQFQTLPSMDDLIDGRVTASQIRKVEIKDLLGREAVELDTEAVGRFLAGRRVLITGAGGSIGTEMCRQVCVFGPIQLILLEQAENNLFDVNNELRRSYPDIEIVPVICDIYDRGRVMTVFKTYRPEVIIHAAAHKHVPLMELNPCEAIKNNIFGTRNIADAACEYDAVEFVQISTDKAVNPSSIMGCTKRVAEIYTQSLNGRGGCRTQFKSVRFGNVLGSAGSVVPTFERQIRAGGPVTVTDPEMTRYFMTIPEASQLVLQAAATGQGGQILLLDMGEPVKIVDLARDMITLSGLRVGEDIDIVFTGVRPGEKLFEELRTDGEDIAPTVHPKIKTWNHVPVPWEKVQQTMAAFEKLSNCPDRQQIIEGLRDIVPEYTPLNAPDQPRPAALPPEAAPSPTTTNS